MKKILLITLSLVLAVSVFAQAIESAKSQATQGTMSSDIDNINASDIFDIDQAFFSAGTMSIPYNYNGNLRGAWAMPLNDNMTVGVTGYYGMDADIRDEESYTSGDADIERTVTKTEDSYINLDAVFMLNNMAFSYGINRSGEARNTTTATSDISTGNVLNEITEATSNSDWSHDLAFVMDMDFMKIAVPVAIDFKNYASWEDHDNNAATPDVFLGTGTKTTIDSSQGSYLTTTTTDTTENNKYVNVALYPNVELPVSIGPLTSVRAGVGFNMDVSNPGADVTTLVTNEGTAVSEGLEDKSVETVTSYDDLLNLGASFNVGTTAEWNKGIMTFIAEPSVNVSYSRNDGGTETAQVITTTDYLGNVTKNDYAPTVTKNSVSDSITPRFTTNVGMEISPKEWFDIRFGLRYNLYWQNSWTTTYMKEFNNAPKTNYVADYGSSFAATAGVGFTLAEDFDLDMMYTGGNVLDLQNAFTITATYRY